MRKLKIEVGDKMKKVVIIGAGQTGRGYAARYLVEKGYKDVTFIDRNHELVKLMDEDKQFTIHFYHKDRTPVFVSNYRIYDSHSVEAKAAIHDCDMLLTAVGEQNLKDVADQIAEGLMDKKKFTTIITFENGINPARVLRNHLKEKATDGQYLVSQSCIFCSTVNVLQTRLDILSQNENYCPYDCDELKEELDFIGALPVKNFENFLKRKVYTYNCLAGLISYCGYIKGYEIYGDAANDLEVSEMMDRLLVDLNPALAKYFGITVEEQAAFAQKAIDKFKDRKILDYNVKNGRAAIRKLGPTERIMAPMKIIKDFGGDTRILEFNAAAALVYWEELQGNGSEPVLEVSPIEKFCEITLTELNSELAKHVDMYFNRIKDKRSCINLINLVYDI